MFESRPVTSGNKLADVVLRFSVLLPPRTFGRAPPPSSLLKRRQQQATPHSREATYLSYYGNRCYVRYEGGRWSTPKVFFSYLLFMLCGHDEDECMCSFPMFERQLLVTSSRTQAMYHTLLRYEVQRFRSAACGSQFSDSGKEVLSAHIISRSSSSHLTTSANQSRQSKRHLFTSDLTNNCNYLT